MPAPGAEPTWPELIPEDQWRVLRAGVAALDGAGIEFLWHGALAFAACTGHWRNTKDLDAIVRPRDREAAVAAM